MTAHCLRSRDLVNVIVSGKQPEPQWLDMPSAIRHCSAGLGIWEWASNDQGYLPDVVMACAGDVPTMETLAAVDFLRRKLPDLKIRVVNVVDLMTLQPREEHPHGLSDKDFDSLFTVDRPVIFAYHGYPWLIHRLTYRRTNHENIHVRGYKEEGTTTTPFDMTVRNEIDRFSLARDVIDRVPGLASAPRTCARLCAISTWITESTSASTATTCPWSRTGPGATTAGRRPAGVHHRTLRKTAASTAGLLHWPTHRQTSRRRRERRAEAADRGHPHGEERPELQLALCAGDRGQRRAAAVHGCHGNQPHRPEEFDNLPEDTAEQARLTMEVVRLATDPRLKFEMSVVACVPD